MKKQIHFIGIGGIGVSALATYYLQKGWEVSGSDLVSSELTERLKKLGANISIGKPRASLVSQNIEKVIYSPAVPADHPERQTVRKQKIAEFSYPEALGELTKDYVTIAVSGTHGKSTTAAMIGLVLLKAKKDPTVIVGTKIQEFGEWNCRVGKSNSLVIEADEHFASFLNYHPQIIVLTSLEADHLDFYKTLENLKQAFKKYVSRLPRDGVVVANKDDKNIRDMLKGQKRTVLWYSLSQKEAQLLSKQMKLPGKHNTANALATLTVARTLGIPDKTSIQALSLYKGSWRRFEVFRLQKPKPYTLISDYGHHPTEIAATLQAARQKWPKKQIVLVYQPHQYQRTFYLFKDFVEVLSHVPVQKLILVDIYDVAGREEGSIRKKVSSAKLAKAVAKKGVPYEVVHIPTLKETQKYLMKNIQRKEVVIVMGAGDIYNLTVRLTQKL
tara:strand:- start:567 stop:1895 length:1329 start_codon:yes stop_codon:yes gene_type:complete